jgi:hypothetical protein
MFLPAFPDALPFVKSDAFARANPVTENVLPDDLRKKS